MNEPLISVQNLGVHFPLRGALFGPRPVVRAVEGISLEIEKGHFFGLVGESGSGKTTLGRAILKAVPITHGNITFDDGEKTLRGAKPVETGITGVSQARPVNLSGPVCGAQPAHDGTRYHRRTAGSDEDYRFA